MLLLAIDTSCDETSVAIVDKDRVLANKLSSQIKSHKEWGGVVPSLAKRKHEELIDLVIEKALRQASVTLEKIDVFAVTVGPGLAIALEVGIKKVQELAHRFKKPVVAVNHMEGHIHSAFAKNSQGKPELTFTFPVLCLLISGGHTEFVLMQDHGKYQIIGETLDDSIGEAYDKVGRMLDMGYPAGPVLEVIARNGNEHAYDLPVPMKYSGNANMSYSGLKTATMQVIQHEISSSRNIYTEKFNKRIQESYKKRFGNIKIQSDSLHETRDEAGIVADIAASFQRAAVEQLLLKTRYIIQSVFGKKPPSHMIIAGGVAQNIYIRKKFRRELKDTVTIHYPTSPKLYTDNAGMIGIAAYYNALRGNFISDIKSLDRMPNWRVETVSY